MAPFMFFVFPMVFGGRFPLQSFLSDFLLSWKLPGSIRSQDLPWLLSPLSSLQSCYGALTSWRVWKVGDDTGGTEIGRRCIISANRFNVLMHFWVMIGEHQVGWKFGPYFWFSTVCQLPLLLLAFAFAHVPCWWWVSYQAGGPPQRFRSMCPSWWF